MILSDMGLSPRQQEGHPRAADGAARSPLIHLVLMLPPPRQCWAPQAQGSAQLSPLKGSHKSRPLELLMIYKGFWLYFFYECPSPNTHTDLITFLEHYNS